MQWMPVVAACAVAGVAAKMAMLASATARIRRIMGLNVAQSVRDSLYQKRDLTKICASGHGSCSTGPVEAIRLIDKQISGLSGTLRARSRRPQSADGAAAGAVALCDAGSEDTLNLCRVKIGLLTAYPMLTAALALARAVHGRLISAAMRLHIVADKVDRIVLN